VAHTLPDGTVIDLPSAALARCGEALFDPTAVFGAPAAGLTDELLVSVKGCINDYRRQMYALRLALSRLRMLLMRVRCVRAAALGWRAWWCAEGGEE
jgi:hypothetical protein